MHGLLSDSLVLSEVYFRLKARLSDRESFFDVQLGGNWLRSWSDADAQVARVNPNFGVSFRFGGLELAISGGPGRKVHISTVDAADMDGEKVRDVIDLMLQNFLITQIIMVDAAYSARQSIKDIELYKRNFGPNDTASLKIGSNRLPPPLEREEIMISENPGRLIFRRDYIEGVSSEMWLGNSFWRYSISDKERVLSEKWLETRDCGDYLHVRAFSKTFTREDGEEGGIQRRLFQLFFGK